MKLPPTKYSSLQDTSDFHCEASCLCKPMERSSFDKMQYQMFVEDRMPSIYHQIHRN